MENKTLSQLINETETKMVNVLNESNLAPEVLELIIRNIMLSIHNSVNSSPAPQEETETAKEE